MLAKRFPVTIKLNAAVGSAPIKQRAERRRRRRRRSSSRRQSVAGRGERFESGEKALGARERSRRCGGEFVERIYKMVSAMSGATVFETRLSPLPITQEI